MCFPSQIHREERSTLNKEAVRGPRTAGRPSQPNTKMVPILDVRKAIDVRKLRGREVNRRDNPKSQGKEVLKPPEKAIDREKIGRAATVSVGRKENGKWRNKGVGSDEKACASTREEIFERPVSNAMKDFQKQVEKQHRKVREHAVELWGLLDNPVFDGPLDPESAFSKEAILQDKRGRMSTLGTARIGSNNTKRAIRDFERSARRYGSVNEEAGRLREYPTAAINYVRIMTRLRR